MLETLWCKPGAQGFEAYTCSSFITAKEYSIRVFNKMPITTLLSKHTLTVNSCIFTPSVKSK